MSDAGFLGRWSRRKRAALAAPVPSPPAVAPAPGPVPVDAFDPATLPPVDTLTAASEIRDFLREGVPAALRQAALRRVWALDPAIAGFIGPADYAWDFNAPDGMPGFALSMPSDMGQMLARAIGLDDVERVSAAVEPADGAAAEPAAPVEVVVAPEALASEPAPAVAVPGAVAEPVAPASPKRHGAAIPV